VAGASITRLFHRRRDEAPVVTQIESGPVAKITWPNVPVPPPASLVAARQHHDELLGQQDALLKQMRGLNGKRGGDLNSGTVDRQVDRLHRRLKEIDPLVRAARERFLEHRQPWTGQNEIALQSRDDAALAQLDKALGDAVAVMAELDRVEKLRRSCGSSPRQLWRRDWPFASIVDRVARALGKGG
jgi:hypothetical protein